jgi:hypothetical protein
MADAVDLHVEATYAAARFHALPLAEGDTSANSGLTLTEAELGSDQK